MSYYIVFGSIKRPADFMGGKRLDWSNPPVGVYEAATPADACQAAASDQGQMATYFAVEGTPWGVDMVEAPARQLGRSASPQERMADHLDRIERLDEQRRELEHRQLVEARQRAGRGPHEPTREERIAAAEAKSAQMEREAGLDEYADPLDGERIDQGYVGPRESAYGEEH